MPYKDYACPCCGYEIVNVKKRMDDSEKPICPRCGTYMEQVFHKMPGVIFNGTGWTPKIGGGRKK